MTPSSSTTIGWRKPNSLDGRRHGVHGGVIEARVVLVGPDRPDRTHFHLHVAPLSVPGEDRSRMLAFGTGRRQIGAGLIAPADEKTWEKA